MDAPEPTVYGLCQCGCGSKTRIARYNEPSNNRIAGQPLRFLPGHRARLQSAGRPEYREEDRGFTSKCWVWQRAVAKKKGYGTGRDESGKLGSAHRIVWERHRGAIPDGMQLDHLCRVRSCVNPEHLEVVTAAENVRRGKSAKLTPTQVAEIRATEARHCDLARVYGVDESAIRAVRSGKRWRDVTPLTPTRGE